MTSKLKRKNKSRKVPLNLYVQYLIDDNAEHFLISAGCNGCKQKVPLIIP